MMRNRFVHLLSVSLLAVFLSLQAGCGRGGDSSAAPETFIFARGSDAQKLDPADVDDGESVNTLTQICEGLVRFKSGTLEIEPCLAKSVMIEPDGLTYRFELREGVTFHDGTPLTAEVALFSFRRQMEDDHPGHLPGANFQYWRYLYQDVIAVEAEGPMTIVFRLSQPNASLLNSLAIFPAFLVSPAGLDTYGADFQRHPIGTGPWRFVSWEPNEAIIMERNPDYWDKAHAPQFERLVMKVVPDNTVRLLELRSGRVHGLDGLQPAEVVYLDADPGFTVYQHAGLNVGYLSFNLNLPKYQNPEIRAAIAMAINRTELAMVALDGAGRPATYPIPPGFLGEPSLPDPIVRDVEKAREIIARHADLFTEPIKLQVMSAPRQYFPDPVKVASFIRSELERIGLQVEIVSKDFKSHLADLRDFNYDLGLIGWVGDNGDTDNFLGILLGSWAAVKGSATNFSDYRNEEMDRVLLAARAETNKAVRQKLYEEALAIWRRDLPIVPLIHGDNIAVMRSEVTGFELQLIGDLRLGPLGWKARGEGDR
ncbi:MAG: ABC transporter substrate-binding protein [Opitutaceae bacterium]